MPLSGLHKTRRAIIILAIMAILLNGLVYYKRAMIWYYSYQLAQLVKGPDEVDAARKLVNAYSIHTPAGDADPGHISDTAQLLQRIYWAIGGAEKPIATCGPRAAAMRAILDRLGYKSRTIYAFSDDYQSIQSHTFLEIKIGGAWQVQDPDFNIYYVGNDGQRIGALDILDGNGEPANGWRENDYGLFPLQSYFDALMIVDDGAMIIKSFDLKKQFPDNGNIGFVDFALSHYDRLEWRHR